MRSTASRWAAVLATAAQVMAWAIPSRAGAGPRPSGPLEERPPANRFASSASDPQTVVVGGDRDYPPYEFLDQSGNPAGYNVDLTRAIAEVMGLRAEIRLGGWSEMWRALLDGRVDALEGVSYSEGRAQQLDLSPPHTIVNHAIFARRETPPVASLEDLRGHEVAVHAAGIMDEVFGWPS